MPFKSDKQRRLMFAALKGKVKGVSKKVAREFINKSHKKKKK